VQTTSCQKPTHLTPKFRAALSDAVKGFQRECLLGRLRGLRYLLADAVVNVADIAGLPARQSAKPLLRGVGLPPLKVAAMLSEAATTGLDRRAAVLVSLAIGRDFHDAEVNAKHEGRFYRRGRRHLNRGIEVEMPVPIHKVGLPLSFAEMSAIVAIRVPCLAGFLARKVEFPTRTTCPLMSILR
jgi:hypothetical protein